MNPARKDLQQRSEDAGLALDRLTESLAHYYPIATSLFPRNPEEMGASEKMKAARELISLMCELESEEPERSI